MMPDTGITPDTAEVAALAVDGPQPVWMTLNAARERAFTGEIVFETDPEVSAYLDNGMVYYAERATDLSLGHRLISAGVIDAAQLECGTVRVGDIEHLGRLFDRDPSIDRDAVTVLAEATTQELIAELANRSIASVRFTAYRHHPSGVHRWFVPRLDPSAMTPPVSAVAHLETTALDELPSLSFDEADVGDLVIEWDDEINDLSERYSDAFELTSALVEFDGAGIDTDARERACPEPDAHVLVDAEDAAATPTDVASVDLVDEAEVHIDLVDVPDVGEAAPRDFDFDFDFSVVWPDGFDESTTETTAFVARSTTSADDLSDNGGLRFTMPPLELGDQPDDTNADVPDDVAEAVRRAIAAIESAGIDAAPTASDVEPAALDGADDHGEGRSWIPTDAAEGAGPAPRLPAPAGLGGFAPPTMATHADVLYAQMDAAESMLGATPRLDRSPIGGAASGAFVDDRAQGGAKDGADGRAGSGDDRSSALRRLIGSLRRKDH